MLGDDKYAQPKNGNSAAVIVKKRKEVGRGVQAMNTKKNARHTGVQRRHQLQDTDEGGMRQSHQP